MPQLIIRRAVVRLRPTPGKHGAVLALLGLLGDLNNAIDFSGTASNAVRPLVAMTNTCGSPWQTWRAIAAPWAVPVEQVPTRHPARRDDLFPALRTRPDCRNNPPRRSVAVDGSGAEGLVTLLFKWRESSAVSSRGFGHATETAGVLPLLWRALEGRTRVRSVFDALLRHL